MIRYDKMRHLLQKAQDTYGYPNQIMVAIEELCELVCVLTKYSRYPNHETASNNIRKKVIEEVADVMIVLEHLRMIFDIIYMEEQGMIEAKLNRLERWLDSEDKSMYQTVIDREVVL